MGFSQGSSSPCFQLHFAFWKMKTKLPRCQQAAIKAVTEGDLGVCCLLLSAEASGPLVALATSHGLQ